jgi:hypothetical protein
MEGVVWVEEEENQRGAAAFFGESPSGGCRGEPL